MKKLLEEFKQFIARGNVLDMAVGVVVASAFVSGLLTPIIGLLLPDTTFAEWEPGGFAIGEVINAVITFFITAAAVFTIVKAVNAVSNLKKKPEEEPAAPTTKTCPYCLMDDVKIGATKCPHCASVLPPEDEEEKKDA